MARFQQDISEFDDFLNKRKRSIEKTITKEKEPSPVFDLEDKTEESQKCVSRRKYNSEKNKAFLQHLTDPKSYSSKGKQKIVDYVSKMAVENNKLEKELEEEKNCNCSRVKEGLSIFPNKNIKKPKSLKSQKYRTRKRPKRTGIFKSLLGADGGEEIIEIENVRRPLIDFKSKNTWLGLTVLIGAIYLINKNK